MKVLYYNWIQFDKKNNSGGGVNVYQKNLIEEISKDKNNEVYFLSSGIYYNFFKKRPYIKETKNIFGDRCKTFKLINSTVTAPAKTMAKDIENYIKDDKDYEILKEFIKEKGKFDVIHFNNIEGLSLKCLNLKKDFPDTKFIFSIHNYFPFCPQINLFFNEEENCVDYCDGKKCAECTKNFPTKKASITYYKLDNKLEKIHMENQSSKIKILFKKLKSRKNEKMKSEGIAQNENEVFKVFRRENVKALNENFDTILAVSDRVKEIAIRMGINEEKIFTNYIGTKFADNAVNRKIHVRDENFINIIYLGYFDKMKGFDFLIDSLEKIPKEYGKKIKFYCYAKVKSDADKEKIKRVNDLKEKLLEVNYFDGYTHDELPKILSNMDLGVVPVIWEDNLPQIAIEMVSSGVPIFTSELGGAHELFDNPDFVFRAGNSKDFLEKLEKLIDGNKKLDEFFNTTKKLTKMDEHINAILNYYNKE